MKGETRKICRNSTYLSLRNGGIFKKRQDVSQEKVNTVFTKA